MLPLLLLLSLLITIPSVFTEDISWRLSPNDEAEAELEADLSKPTAYKRHDWVQDTSSSDQDSKNPAWSRSMDEGRDFDEDPTWSRSMDEGKELGVESPTWSRSIEGVRELRSSQPKDSRFISSNNSIVTAQVSSTAVLHCRTSSATGGLVSWIRKRDYQLLTVGLKTHSMDDRFTINYVHWDWQLHIRYVQPRDAGIYECQVSSHPPTSIFLHLQVVEAEAEILGAPEKHVKAGSILRLVCILHYTTESPAYVFWYRDQQMINYNEEQSVVVESDEHTSVLLVTRADRQHSGNYTCLPSNAKPASILVHILNGELGEYPAAMQHGESTAISRPPHCLLLPSCLLLLLLLSPTMLHTVLYSCRGDNPDVVSGVRKESKNYFRNSSTYKTITCDAVHIGNNTVDVKTGHSVEIVLKTSRSQRSQNMSFSGFIKPGINRPYFHQASLHLIIQSSNDGRKRLNSKPTSTVLLHHRMSEDYHMLITIASLPLVPGQLVSSDIYDSYKECLEKYCVTCRKYYKGVPSEQMKHIDVRKTLNVEYCAEFPARYDGDTICVSKYGSSSWR